MCASELAGLRCYTFTAMIRLAMNAVFVAVLLSTDPSSAPAHPVAPFLKRPAPEFTAHVITVTDGQSFRALVGGRALMTMRLHGVEAPPLDQPFGEEAKAFLAERIFDRDVTIRMHGKDKYRRMVVDVLLADGRLLNSELVKAGMAWCRSRTTNRTLVRLEAEARAARRGLWAVHDAGAR